MSGRVIREGPAKVPDLLRPFSSCFDCTKRLTAVLLNQSAESADGAVA